MKTLTITLQGQAIAKALAPVAYSFAHLYIRDTAMVRGVKPLTSDERERLRDCRRTLECVCPDLPPVVEPEWPMHYRPEDMVTVKKGRVKDIAGFSMVFGREEKPRRGAKPVAYYSPSLVSKAADEWRDAFVKLMTETQEQGINT